jgi:DNA-binding response OmpR family regulator
LSGNSILIVEDEPLIALDVQSALKNAGASILAAGDATDAVRLAASKKLTAAVLDVDLGDLDCWVVCRLLARGGVPFLFYTGYVQSEVFKDWPEAPVLAKPASHEQIVGAVADIIHSVRSKAGTSTSAAADSTGPQGSGRPTRAAHLPRDPMRG